MCLDQRKCKNFGLSWSFSSLAETIKRYFVNESTRMFHIGRFNLTFKERHLFDFDSEWKILYPIWLSCFYFCAVSEVYETLESLTQLRIEHQAQVCSLCCDLEG